MDGLEDGSDEGNLVVEIKVGHNDEADDGVRSEFDGQHVDITDGDCEGSNVRYVEGDIVDWYVGLEVDGDDG